MTRLTQLLPGIPTVESPLFPALLAEMELSETERQVANDLHTRGYAVIDFPDSDIMARIDRVKATLAPRFSIDLADPASIKAAGNQRIQDAWAFDEDVKAIAINPALLALLGRLYGRRAFPFQTLNFPVGTQQHVHSDSLHFSSVPERFMCGVWLAMEDIHPDAGPLTYCPGSHRWPILSNLMLGNRRFGDRRELAQTPYEPVWRAMMAAHQAETETFLARKGQALIWAANLLHGGSPQHDPTRTRWSQVTHYYFENCAYYTPAYSDEALGRLDLRRVVNIATGAVEPNVILGEELTQANPPAQSRRGWFNRRLRRDKPALPPALPDDFDPATYLSLHADVAVAGVDGAEHYLHHGRAEGRIYK